MKYSRAAHNHSPLSCTVLPEADGLAGGGTKPKHSVGRPANHAPRKSEKAAGKLILVRHGHTSLNLAGEEERLRGWLDVPLDSQGLREAEETAAWVARYGIEVIYSSDLTRAIQTSEAISRTTRAPIIPTPELRPWNLGSFAGQLIREIIPFLDLLHERPEIPAPGGESWDQFYTRYSRRLLSLMELAADSAQTVAAVAHVRNFLTAPTVIAGGDRNQVPVKGGPPTGSVYVIEKVDGKWRLHSGQRDASQEHAIAVPPRQICAPAERAVVAAGK